MQTSFLSALTIAVVLPFSALAADQTYDLSGFDGIDVSSGISFVVIQGDS